MVIFDQEESKTVHGRAERWEGTMGKTLGGGEASSCTSTCNYGENMFLLSLLDSPVSFVSCSERTS